MTLPIIIEILLDGILLFLASYGIFGERSRIKINDGLPALLFALFCCVSRISALGGADTIIFSIGEQGYEILPVNSLPPLLFLFLAVTVTNSIYFQKNAVYTLFGTMSAFSITMISREIFILLFYGLGAGNHDWNPLICRVSSVLLLVSVLYSPFFKWLIEKLKDDSLPVKLLIGNTTAFLCALVAFLDFDATKTSDHLLTITGTILTLLIINLFVGIYMQKHSAEKKRIILLEQYIPVIEELITQVRARQHEFNNRLLAISAAAQTASSLEQAKAEIAELTAGLQFDITEKSLLGCDSKITAGMIFSKIKYAETKKIKVVSEITAPLKEAAMRELDVVEIVGILMDNAIEASNTGDIIYVNIEHHNDGLSISVSNPYEMQSTTEFIRMFRRGFSTKAGSGARGYGLANVKEIAERQGGKLLTRNETLHERNYVTIGVIFP